MNNAMMMQKYGKVCAPGALLVVLVPMAAALWIRRIGVQIWSEWNRQRQVDILAAFEAGKQWSEVQEWYEHGRQYRDSEKPKSQKDREEEEKATPESEAEHSKSKPVVLASGDQEWLVQEEQKW